MKIRNILLGFLFCFLCLNLNAQDKFSFKDLINWSKGKKAQTEETLTITTDSTAFSSIAIDDETFDGNAYYRLTTQWLGEGKSLDIINDGNNNQPILAKSNNYSGQLWKLTKVDDLNNYALTTEWQGLSKRLDYNEGANQNSPMLNESENESTVWNITPLGNGYFKITNFLFNDRSLDVVNDGENNKIQVAKTGNYTGQSWKITKVEL